MSEAKASINFDQFSLVDLRVATVLEAKSHPNADKLLVLKLSLGDGQERQICAGLKTYYQPEELVGKRIVIVANLEPRTMRGEISQGMLLASSDPTGKPILLTTMGDVGDGSPVG